MKCPYQPRNEYLLSKWRHLLLYLTLPELSFFENLRAGSGGLVGPQVLSPEWVVLETWN